MGTKRKFAASGPEATQAPRKSEITAMAESVSYQIPTTRTRTKKAALLLSRAANEAASLPASTSPSVEEIPVSTTISRPLEPPPDVHTLPVDESFCPSGFNMLEILMKVATRPKPVINIGAVDFSCAFCVCDVTQPDLPIVYCSEGFEKLTGYTEAEIMGRNCRFLQTPGGKTTRERSKQDANTKILHDLRRAVSRRDETQHSLLNYRKDGTCFQNLVTMIPIAWDSPDIRYYVGFQADAGSLGR